MKFRDLIFVVALAGWAGFMILFTNYWESPETVEAFNRAECIYHPIRVHAVWAYGVNHPCYKYADEYRWVETQGMGYLPDGGVNCRVVALTASRPLDCVYGRPVRPVPGRDVDRYYDVDPAEFRKILRQTRDYIPGYAGGGYSPPESK